MASTNLIEGYNKVVQMLDEGLPLHKVGGEFKKIYPPSNLNLALSHSVEPLYSEASFYSSQSAEITRKFLEKKYNISLQALRETSLAFPPVVETQGQEKITPAFATYLGGGIGGRPVGIVGPMNIEVKTNNLTPVFSGEVYVPLRPSRYDILEGVNYGLKLINDMSEDSCIHVVLDEFAKTTRSPVLEFEDRETLRKAKKRIREIMPKIKNEGNKLMKDVGGNLEDIQIYTHGRELFINLVYEMKDDFYGHENLTSSAEKVLEEVISPELNAKGYKHDILMLAGGVDGDLRPGKNNIRGRKSRAFIEISEEYLRKILKKTHTETKETYSRRLKHLNETKYLVGNNLLGTYTHTGMELEILDAFFNSIEPPTPPFVSSFIDVNIETIEDGLIYEVRCKNFEMGTRFEGPVSETGIECRNILAGGETLSAIKAVAIGTAVLLPGGLNQHRLMEVGGLGRTKKTKKIYDIKNNKWR